MTHMGSSLIVEARGFGAAEIAAFNWNEYISLIIRNIQFLTQKAYSCREIFLVNSFIDNY